MASPAEAFDPVGLRRRGSPGRRGDPRSHRLARYEAPWWDHQVVGIIAMIIGGIGLARHWWPTALVFLAQVLALLASGGAIASWYLDRYGQIETVSVSARFCEETRYDYTCEYVLRRDDVSEIPGTIFVSTSLEKPEKGQYQVGNRVTVVVDPKGRLNPRSIDVLHDGLNVDILVWAWASTAAILATAAVTGIRRAGEDPGSSPSSIEPGQEAHVPNAVA